MKKLFLCLSVITLAACSSFSQNDPQNDKNKPEITFKEIEFDFGNVQYGGNGQHEFVFTNTGKTDLILQDVRPSCGCTASEYTKAPVKSGEKGTIKITYNTKNSGNFTKTITVTSNAKTSPVVLRIKGNVEPMKSETTK
jgi:hypothetical protein